MFEAVVEKAGVSARGEGVRHRILGIRVPQGKPGFVLIGGQDLRVTRHQLPRQVVVGGDEPLANRVLGDRWVLFATRAREDERRAWGSTLAKGLTRSDPSQRTLTPGALKYAGLLLRCLETLWRRGCFLFSAG